MKCLSEVSFFLLITVVSSKLNPIHCSPGVHKSAIQCGSNKICPTWFTCNSHGNCQCDPIDGGAVLCDNAKLVSAVKICHCVTYDKDTGSTFLGACFYNCKFNGYGEEKNVLYQQLPKDPEILINNSACTPFHRTGLLCGDCEEGYSPLVLSYSLSCIKCPDSHKNWWKFILKGFLPLTFFCFFLIVFSINVTSSRLHGVVWFSQSLSIPLFVRVVLFAMSKGNNQWQLKIAKVFIMFCSYWTLDIFRDVIPDVCLDVNTLQALSLEYLVALYPYAIAFLSYISIKLYDRNYKFVVVAWKPFKKMLSFFRMSWNVHTSIIDSFSTFFFLSYIKILSVSADLLIPTKIYQLGSSRTTLGLYYSPTVAYFGDQHLPYAVLAIVILTVFVCIPMIAIILYPYSFFQRFLSLFPVNWHFLHAFVDSFQGSYKDGTEHETLDCRWFSSVITLSRPFLFISFSLTLSMMYFVYAIIILVTLLIAAINIEPFKKVVNYFSTDLIFYFLFTLIYIAIVGRQLPVIKQNAILSPVLAFLAILSASVPMLYTAFLVISWFLSKKNK